MGWCVGRGGEGKGASAAVSWSMSRRVCEKIKIFTADPVDRCFFTRGPWWTVNQGSVDRCFFTRGPWWTVVFKEIKN